MFSASYAAIYDLLYAGKDYESECRLLEQVFSGWPGGVRSVLDLGCGTGGHAVRLVASGYQVTGVDRSPAMLDAARRRGLAPAGAGERLRLVEADIRALALGASFDAVTAMFAVLGYQTSEADLASTLRGVRHHLREGGAFVFDGWWGPGVLESPPTDRLKAVEAAGVRVVRRASPGLDLAREVVDVHYSFERFEGTRLVDRGEETHPVRFHFPGPLEERLTQAGLKLVRLGAFSDPSRPPTTSDWNYLAVAQAA